MRRLRSFLRAHMRPDAPRPSTERRMRDAQLALREVRDGAEGWYYPWVDRWLPRIAGASIEEVTVRPTSNASSSQWVSLLGKEQWQEVAQTAVDNAEVGEPGRGIKCVAEGNKKQGFTITTPALGGGKCIKTTFHMYGKWTAKLKVTLSGFGGGSKETEIESVAQSKWAVAGWSVITGGAGWPYVPWTQAECETMTAGSAGIFLLTNGKATSTQEVNEVYAVFTIEHAGSSLTREATEAISMVESTSRTVESPRTVAQGVAMAETTARILESPRPATDSASVAESPSRILGSVRTATDTAGMAEATSRLMSTPRSPADGVSMAEAPTRIDSQPRGATDSVAVGESASISRGKSREASESIAMVESTSRLVGLVRSVVESITLAEVATRARHWAQSAAESITMVEAWRVEGNVQRKVRFFSRWAAGALTGGRIAAPPRTPARYAQQAQPSVDQEVVRP